MGRDRGLQAKRTGSTGTVEGFTFIPRAMAASLVTQVKASACNAGDPRSVLGLEDSWEKEMGTHSSILTWRIPWTEEPGGLQSMGSQSQTQL